MGPVAAIVPNESLAGHDDEFVMLMHTLADQPAPSSGQSPPVPAGAPTWWVQLFLVPRDYVRMIGIIATIEHIVT